MSQQDDFNTILSSLHAAALGEDLWPEASGRVDELCGIYSNTLVVGSGMTREEGKILFFSTCYAGERRQDWEQDYAHNYYLLDERAPRLPHLPPGKLFRIHDLYRNAERKTSATYGELLPRAHYQNGLDVRMDGPDGTNIYWTLGDSTRRGGWESGQVEMLESLLPHVRHCVETRHALAGARALNQSLQGLLDNTGLGIIQLDQHGQIRQMNDRARGVLNGRRALFEQGRFLYASLPAEDLRLRRLIADALPRLWAPPTGGTMAVTRGPGQPRQMIHVLPVGTWHGSFGGSVAVLVLVREPGVAPRFDADYVAAALGLTRAESRVAMALALGRTVGEISLDTGREVSTARFHVRRIFAKLGLSRQADLIRVVLSLADPPELGREAPMIANDA